MSNVLTFPELLFALIVIFIALGLLAGIFLCLGWLIHEAAKELEDTNDAN